MNQTAAPLPWQNSSLPVEERIRDLIGALTLDEKIGQLTTDAPAIERIGLPQFKWGGECLHGLCCTGNATQYPMPIGMAATFDPALIEKAAATVSDEARAKHHDPAWRNTGRASVGLAFYTPVINILRDPRWGRSQETYGEDPVLTALMGAAFVRGLQGSHPKYLKVAACAKHLGAHSGPEKLRREFNALVSRKDLAETYLAAFEALIKERVATIMATYNRVNGEHCCASPTLIGEFMRERYGFDGMVMSDGGALGSLHTSHKITKDAIETAGLCLRNGCDQEIGRNAYPFAAEAIQRGLITEADIDRALARIFKVRFQVGEFDPPEQNPYTALRANVIQCAKHIRLARDVARKSMVLLKNNGILPFTPDKRVILVTGPNAADIQVLLGNFYRGGSGDMRTIYEGIVASAPEGTVVTHAQGCFLTHPNVYESTWTFGLAEWADAVVMVIGYSPLMEGEQGECIGAPDGGDKAGIDIPANQLDFLRKMKEVGKPIVAVVTGGSPLALGEVHDIADAVLMAWYPGEQGGMAAGDLLFGKECPSGKLPVTFPTSLDQVPDYTDYSMANRTYRYMQAEPMYPFGFGLSYTTFEYGGLTLSKEKVKAGNAIKATVAVKNTGARAADEVVQLYLTDDEASVPVPHWALKAFKRVSLEPGESTKVTFKITPEMMSLFDMDGNPKLEPGSFTVTIGGSSPGARSAALGAPAPVTATFVVK
ncbi:glycoside hydrolase family 3 protein [bacterium]|nr:glycoside hydrolase family 3 protein [bacterium]